MSDYTPTTDEVRWAYGDARCTNRDDPAHAHGCPQDVEFDRWLAAHDAEVRSEWEAEQSIERDSPTERTSNYGWALWHLDQAKRATSVGEAQMHATCAQARAQLQTICEMGVARGVDPNGPTVWEPERPEEWA